jgi:hypothetical protein
MPIFEGAFQNIVKGLPIDYVYFIDMLVEEGAVRTPIGYSNATRIAQCLDVNLDSGNDASSVISDRFIESISATLFIDDRLRPTRILNLESEFKQVLYTRAEPVAKYINRFMYPLGEGRVYLEANESAPGALTDYAYNGGEQFFDLSGIFPVGDQVVDQRLKNPVTTPRYKRVRVDNYWSAYDGPSCIDYRIFDQGPPPYSLYSFIPIGGGNYPDIVEEGPELPFGDEAEAVDANDFEYDGIVWRPYLVEPTDDITRLGTVSSPERRPGSAYLRVYCEPLPTPDIPLQLTIRHTAPRSLVEVNYGSCTNVLPNCDPDLFNNTRALGYSREFVMDTATAGWSIDFGGPKEIHDDGRFIFNMPDIPTRIHVREDLTEPGRIEVGFEKALPLNGVLRPTEFVIRIYRKFLTTDRQCCIKDGDDVNLAVLSDEILVHEERFTREDFPFLEIDERSWQICQFESLVASDNNSITIACRARRQ